MKRLLTACLLIVFLTACLPLGAGLAAAKTDVVPEEFRLMRYAQALYDEISSAYNTAQGYRIAQFNRKEFYRDRLAKADLYNFTYDYFVNISSALFNLGWGFVTGNVSRMAGAVAGMYVDEAYNFVMDSLKATAPMTVKDYIYAQAHSALDAIDLGRIEDVMERAQNNGGKLVSYEDASELVYRHLANKMNFSTLGMASEYYNKQLNEGVDGAIRDLIVKISLSEVAEKVGQSHFITSTLYDSLINFEFEFLDGIGQQCNEPCVSAWVTEQKEILSEYSKFCGETIDHINLQQYSQPSWVTDDAGRWTCVDGEPCELDVVKVGSTSSRLQLYFPGTGRIETAVFAGIDNRHRAVYLDTKNDAVLCTAGTGTELNLWVTLYGSGGGAEQSASFVRQEYAWAGHWVNTENPNTVLDITSNGNGTLHLAAKFAPDLAFSFDFEPIDYEILYFDTLEKPFPADMRIDGSTGMLEFFLWPSDDYSLPDWIYKEFPVLSRLDEYAGSYFFTTDNPPDLTKYGWGYHEEPDVLSEEESLRLFAGLSETPLMAASGAGAWEGRIRINADGSFTGYYYDADFETIYEVSFSGHFEPHVETMNSVYWLYVEDLKTAQTPGKTAAGEYGETIIYDEPPFYAGDYLLLTLPGTPNDMIPEMVQSEIGGLFDEWEDYSRFITLTRLTDGWGFFADPADPPSYDGEPLATTAPTEEPTPVPTEEPTPVPTEEPTPVPTEEPTPVLTEEPAQVPAETPPPMGLGWVGNWMAHDESMAEMIITDNWNGTLRAQVLCLPAGDIDAALTPVDGSTMLFEHDKGGYNSMLGTLTKREDGTLRLDFTGGEYFEDEEATEYQGYYIGGFTFYPAEYADMWYQTPEDAAAAKEDWLGEWTSRNLDQSSTLKISESGGQLLVDLALGSRRFNAVADMGSDTIISVYGDDDFYCMLILNKKLGRIAMLEVGASSDDVYDLIGSAYYGTVIYDRAIRLPGGSDNLDAVNNVGELPPTLVMPVPTQAPKSSELRPIPGKAGFMQVPASDVGATSYVLGTGDPAAFAPGRMTDGDETTCWQFSTDATKPGQAYIDFDFDSPVTLDEMWMKNGFWKTVDGEDQYVRHSRPKKITIYIRYGGSDAFQKMKTVSLKDDKARKDWKVISMKGVKNVTGVRVRVDEIYKGTKNKTAVCVSEIMFVQAVK